LWEGVGERVGGKYLEPLLTAAIAAGKVAGALVHPHHDGALLVRPLRPDGLDLASGRHLGGQLGRGAAVAHDLPVGDGQGGVVVGPLALDGLGRRGWGEACVAAWGVSPSLNLGRGKVSGVVLTRGR
jgi:hypothetical protein